MFKLTVARCVAISAASLVLASCGGGGGGGSASPGSSGPQPPVQPSTYTVGGNVSGLNGNGLVLRLNGGDDRAIAASGAFAFASPLLGNAAYVVAVASQPVNQTCVVTAGGGAIANANVTNVAVNCTTDTFTVGGTVTGLVGSGLTLRNSGADDKSIVGNGAFTFATSVNTGATYAITVGSQPLNQSCTVSNASAVITANVTNVAINCITNTFTVGGTVTGLVGGGLALRNNGADEKSIATDGAFTFATTVNSGTTYTITVSRQPVDQACTVSHASAVIAANVTSVAIACSPLAHTIGGTVTGLVGTGLILQNNFGDDFVIDANGTFSFPSGLITGESYQISQVLPPMNPLQSCTVTNSAGTISAADVKNLEVTCQTQKARFVFSANSSDNTLSTIAIDDATGQLRPRTIAKTGTLPIAINGEASRSWLYVLNRNSANVTAFDIEPNTAVLTEKTTSPYPIVPNPVAAFIHPSNIFTFYPSNSTNAVAGNAFDPLTGVLSPTPGSPLLGSAMTKWIAYDPKGQFMYELLPTEIKIDSVNATTGALTEVARMPISGSPANLYMHRSGKFLYAIGGTNGVSGYSVNATTGLLTALPGFPFTAISNASWFGTHISGRFIYLRDIANTAISVVAINPTTGALSLAPGSPFITFLPFSLSAHPSGRFLYASTSTSLYAYSIDTATGLVAAVPGSPYALSQAGAAHLDATGKYLYISGSANLTYAFSINQATGALTPLTNTPAMSVGGPATTWLLSAFTGGLTFRSDYAYSINSGDDTISAFSINNATGTMTAIGSPLPAAVASPQAAAMDLRARFLYVASPSSTAVSGFRIGTNGALTSISSPLVSASAPAAIAIDPSGRFAYVAARNPDEVRAYSIDQTSGALQSLGSPLPLAVSSFPIAITMHPNGKFVYVTNGAASTVSGFLINQSTGALFASPGTVSTEGTTPTTLVIDPTGRFAYVTGFSDGTISMFSINGSTGTLTSLGASITASTRVSAMDIDPTGRFVYAADSTSNSITTLSINASTGVLTKVGSIVAVANPTSVKVDYSGKYLYVSRGASASMISFLIDATTGALTAVPSSSVATGAAPANVVISTRTQ